MSGARYWLWVIPVVVAVVLAIWITWVYLAERRQATPVSGGTPHDRWLAGGIFRGDPREVNSRAEVPGPEELASAQQSAREGELPPRPASRGESRN